MNEELFDSISASWHGVPFVHKGRDKTGVDCSWFSICFVNEYFEKNGSKYRMKLPTHVDKSYDQHFFLRRSSFGKSIIRDVCEGLPFLTLKSKSRVDVVKGDILIFPQGTCPGAHMGICISDKGTKKMLHSKFDVGVSIESLRNWRPTFVYR